MGKFPSLSLSLVYVSIIFCIPPPSIWSISLIRNGGNCIIILHKREREYVRKKGGFFSQENCEKKYKWKQESYWKNLEMCFFLNNF